MTAPVAGHVRLTPKISGQFGIVPGAPAEQADPCTMVIFGATGDLTKRKLFPALYQLAAEHLLHPHFAVLAVGREQKETDDSFRERIRSALVESDEVKHFDDEVWQRLAARTFYAGGDASDDSAYALIKQRLVEIEAERPNEERNRFFYLAVPPSVFEPIVRHLSTSGLVPRHENPKERPWARVVVEKPFGHSLETAKQLNDLVLSLFAEHQLYRIDHYLGKETVQNVLVFRFANSIFEPIWNRNHIASVQITMAETFGVQGRGAFYEEAGATRDVLQNHLLAILTFLAMDAPSGALPGAIRDEEARLLRAVEPADPAGVVRGQFRGYLDEPGVAPGSQVETFVALRLFIDSWRWAGVPFYIRAGKCLPVTATSVTIEFKRPPRETFGETVPPFSNHLRFRLGPDLVIGLGLRVKLPSERMVGEDVELVVCQSEGDAMAPYERLLGDALAGDPTLFATEAKVEEEWRIVEPIIHGATPLHGYEPGSWGPEAARRILAPGTVWHDPDAAGATPCPPAGEPSGRGSGAAGALASPADGAAVAPPPGPA